jgi:hypothetical protein
MYPNPTSSALNIEFQRNISDDLTIKVIDYIGREIIVKNFYLDIRNNNLKIDISSLSKSYYIIKITGNKISYSAGFIVK